MKRLLITAFAAACAFTPAGANAQATSSPYYQNYNPPVYVAPTYRVPVAPPAYLTTNRYLGSSVSKYDQRVSAYSPIGSANTYTTSGGKLYGQDGQYLGRVNSNRYDPESISNPYGQYGSRYSSTSVNNPYSVYGSPYSSLSAKNPYSTTPPVIIYPPR
jgi:hypothetical protein